ncbi:MAG: YihY family inner membrane protein [Sulfurimonadaceae bacterium]|nr:YihY family inner membrane protein [Sulfurimonadaceae bacterium]
MSSKVAQLWRHLFFFLKKLFDAELTYYASSLSFYTIFTIVPLLIIVLSLVTNMPSFAEHYGNIKSFIIDNLMPVHSDAVTGYIDSFMQNSVKLGTIGFIMVVVASLLFFDNFEYIVNKIFHSEQRSIWESITTYWTLLTLTPIALAASFYITTKVELFLSEHTSISAWINIMAMFPYLIIWVLFFVIYKISANVKVNTKAAAISSFVIAMVWSIAKNAFIYYVFINKTYATMYGSFSILLFFFLWIYVSWIIFVYGLKLCYLIDRAYKYGAHHSEEHPDVSRSEKE